MIKTLYQLNAALTEGLAWRKKELANLKVLATTLKRDHERAAVRRAAVPIMYSHWEGYVKDGATAYLEFIARQRLKCFEVSTNLLALACRSSIKEAGASERPYVHTQLVDFLVLQETEDLRIPYRDAIQTRSNLNSAVLQDVLWVAGLDYSALYQTKAMLIDGSLLASRNQIAHGKGVQIDEVSYMQLHDLVVELLDGFATDVENAAISSRYRRAAA
jgi:hypothetical protein